MPRLRDGFDRHCRYRAGVGTRAAPRPAFKNAAAGALAGCHGSKA
jgi:hypothetical protein